jgi:hypothetical protein
VLIVDRIGKDISATAWIRTSPAATDPVRLGGPDIAKLVVLDLTEATKATPTAMGKADVVTAAISKTNFPMTYCNALTSRYLRFMMPMSWNATGRGGGRDKGVQRRDLARAACEDKDTLHLTKFHLRGNVAEPAPTRASGRRRAAAMKIDGEAIRRNKHCIGENACDTTKLRIES